MASTSTFDVKVLNSLNDLMFTANVDIQFAHIFGQFTRQYAVSITKVEPGTGNSGKNLEYESVYDGISIKYAKFTELMNDLEY